MQPASRFVFRGLSGTLTPAGLAIVALALAAPASLSAQSAEIKPEPGPGDMVVLRDVPTRAAQREGHGDAFTVSTAPNLAFANALELGIAELDDADAALITSSALNGLNQLALVDNGAVATESLIAETLRGTGLTAFGNPAGGGAGSIVNGSVDAALATADAATSSALGSISTALNGQTGPGQ